MPTLAWACRTRGNGFPLYAPVKRSRIGRSFCRQQDDQPGAAKGQAALVERQMGTNGSAVLVCRSFFPSSTSHFVLPVHCNQRRLRHFVIAMHYSCF